MTIQTVTIEAKRQADKRLRELEADNAKLKKLLLMQHNRPEAEPFKEASHALARRGPSMTACRWTATDELRFSGICQNVLVR